MKGHTRKSAWLLATFAVALLAIEQTVAQDADTLKGEPPDVVVTVKGMVCDNCAYSVEKRVGKLESVETVDVRLDEQEVRIGLIPGKTIQEEALREAILDAGFQPVEVRYSNEEEERPI